MKAQCYCKVYGFVVSIVGSKGDYCKKGGRRASEREREERGRKEDSFAWREERVGIKLAQLGKLNVQA